jgi:UDP-N-acetylglucosamine diphosphorylase/glucosamine-1-phosphate N-acetyltransferase
MTRRLILFEDSRSDDLAPLTDLLPVHALAFGASHLAARWIAAVPEARLTALVGRKTALEAWRDIPALDGGRPESGDDVLIVNVAAVPGPWLGAVLEEPGSRLWNGEGRVVCARAPFATVASGLARAEAFESFLRGLELPEASLEARVIRWPWELLEWNPEALAADLSAERGERAGEIHPMAAVYEPERVSIGAGARIDALAVLDARTGPIRIGPRARVLSHTVVSGPCLVGEGSELLGGSIGRSTLGPQCRIAGEVDSSLWQGWANKRHHGFVGHSVVGEWVNLGALTTTSDLKNTYGRVRVWAGGREVETGFHKIGSFIGSHVKTGIGTLLPTGASIGTASNLFGGGRFAPKHLPAFSWWDGERTVEHRFDRFLETARLAMSRRGRPLDPADEAALEALYSSTRTQRNARGAVAQGSA